ncbi:MAG: FAD-dependent pyridine nucleotide-disulfide oxidoreductase [Candidatus Solibacter sp.]|jgi:NADPH-dependent 2,4-dienoyl-CoA reductase/sulfur reductase-like enzyme|nr:FAD-dependent pyridine nucleotide-disulfide oxidoreductase [Candidatus Solibacter sp.]
MKNGSKFVIVGGGLVAGYAARQFVELDLKPGDLTILSADSAIPYERPSLSKGFLAGRESEAAIEINPAGFYAEHGITLRLDTRVTAVDPKQQRLTLQPGSEFQYESLILATGSRARRFDSPNPNVMYLRSLADAKALHERAAGVKRATVIGGGFIGMEVASVLAGQSIEVTMAMRESRVWEHFFTPELSRLFEDYYTARGVHLMKNASATQLREQSDAAELAVAGVGAEPVLDFLEGSGIAIDKGDKGVTVNENLETNIPGIFAAGDIANYPDLLFNKRRRVEHWDNAVEQGRHIARELMGKRAPFRHVPYFFSDVFDLSYEFWGDTEGADRTELRGDPSIKSVSVWWYRQSAVIGAFVMNRPEDERNSAPKLIESRQAA